MDCTSSYDVTCKQGRGITSIGSCFMFMIVLPDGDFCCLLYRYRTKQTEIYVNEICQLTL